MVKRGAQLGAGTSLPISTICGPLRGCYGISGHLFIASDNYARDSPEIVLNNHDTERSGFSVIEIRQTSRHSETWGHSETEGTSRKRSCLEVFCYGVFLAVTVTVTVTVTVHVVLVEISSDICMQIVVSTVGNALVTVLAYYRSWSKNVDKKPAKALSCAALAQRSVVSNKG